MPRVETLEDRRLLALTWTGAAATNGWADGTVGTLTNWNTQTIPADGDTLIFPAGALQLSNLNNTAGGAGYGLSLSGGGYTLDGAFVTLTPAGISDTAAGDANTIALGLTSDESGLPMEVASSGHALRLTGTLILNGSARKTGDGTLLLIGSAVVPLFGVEQGVLGVGAGVQLDSVNIRGGTLAGVGSVNAVDVGASPQGGALAPGLDGPGVMTAGSLRLPGVTFAAELNGPAAGTGYDQVVSLGNVDINGADLQLSLGFTPNPGQSFTIVDNQGFDSVNGTFNGLPNGALFDVGGVTLRISYDGGDGNDVVVRATGRPIAAPDLYALPGEATFTLFQPTDGVLANDNGPNGLPLQATLASGPTHGTLALNGDGTFSYTPSPGFSGADSFTYTAADTRGASDPATVTLVVNAVTNAPVGADDAYTLNEDTTLAAAPSVLINDVGPAGSTLTAALVVPPVNAQAFTFNNDGTFSYTPAANFNGTDTFRYRPVAGSLSGAMVTVALTVNPVADAPTPVNDAFTMAEDGTLFVGTPGVLANDQNPDAALLTAVVADGPGHGSLVLAGDGSFTYSPDPGFSGADTFTYRAVNGPASSAGVATVTITVAAVNDPPIARDDLAATNQGQAFTIAVLANDSDPDGDTLSAALVNAPLHGAAVVNANGTITYTPAAGFRGTDTFTYRASDGALSSEIATVTVIVDPVNSPPTSQDDAFTMVEGRVLSVAAPGVLANDSDPDGDPMTAVLASGPSNGTLSLSGDGSFTYTPDANFSGTDSFTYRPSDGRAAGAVATVTITVAAVNRPPVARDDIAETDQGQAVTIAVLSNDSDPDGDALSAALVNTPLHGAAVVNANGTITYTPLARFRGTDTFTYRASDGALSSELATVTVIVDPVNSPPTSQDDAFTMVEGRVLSVAAPGVLANDSDPDGDRMTAVLADGPDNGSLSISGDGSFTYTPDANFSGTDSFTYHASDGRAVGALATVTITVGSRPSAPTANDDAYTLLEDVPLEIPAPGILANDLNPDGGAVAVVVLAQPLHGAVDADPSDGSFTYTPAADYNGPDSFTYYLSGATLNSGVATVRLTVLPVADPPVGVSDEYTTNEDVPLVVAGPGVLLNDENPDGGALGSVLAAGPEHGSVLLNADGSFTYTPRVNFNGVDAFSYVPRNGGESGGATTATIVVRSVNSPPVAANDVYATPESRRLEVPGPGILGNDTDPDEGDALSAVLVNPPRHGTLSLGSDGSFTYTPEELFAGTDEFTYRATDGQARSDVATVTIGVSGIRTTLVELEASSDTGVSATDRVTRDATPVFVGSAQPGLGLTLLAQPAGSSARTPVATATADAAGNFHLASSALADGAYEFFVTGARPDGLPTGTVAAGTLLIDTVAPVITGAVLVPKAGQIQVVFADDRSGLAAATLADRENYRVARRFGPTPAGAGPNEVRVLPAATPGGPQAVVLKIYNGRRVPRGRLMLAVLSGGVTDVAGNPMAGLFTGAFPTIAPAGTNFLGEFHVRNRKPTVAENTAARFPISLPEPAATIASVIAEPLPSPSRHHRWLKGGKKAHR